MKRKGIITSLLVMTMTGALLAGCGGKTSNSGKTEEKESTKKTESTEPEKTDIKLGITAGFTDFTDYIPDMMKEWGYNVEIVTLDDPVVADNALVEGSIDASYHQHLPYLEAYNKSNGTNLHACEPYIMSSMDSIVSLKYSSVDEVPDGATIAVANDESNLSINLEDLQELGWIKLKDIPEDSYYTLFDIEENKKNLNFLEVDMFSRAAALQDEADLAMIFYSNTGAAKYGYHLLKIFDENIAYPQVVAVRDEDKDSQWVKDLMKAFTSDKQVERINEKNQPDVCWKILFE